MRFTIRRAGAGDEQALRALRIRALTDAPAAFGSTLTREQARTLADWQRWLSPHAVYFLETDAAHGLVAGMRDENDARIVHLRSMWVDPALRGTGAADELVAAVVAWAKEIGAAEVVLDIAKGNDRARGCYERCGFKLTGRETAGTREGLIEVEMRRKV